MASGGAHDDDGHTVVPLVQRPAWIRLDVAPFLAAYLSLVILDICAAHSSSATFGSSPNDATNDVSDDGWELGVPYDLILDILWLVTLLTHVSLFIWTRWNVSIRTSVGYQRCTTTPTEAAAAAASRVSNEKMRNGGEDYTEILDATRSIEAVHRSMDTMKKWTHALIVPPPSHSIGSSSSSSSAAPNYSSTAPSTRPNKTESTSASPTATATAADYADAEIVPLRHNYQMSPSRIPGLGPSATTLEVTAEYRGLTFRCTALDCGREDVAMDSIWLIPSTTAESEAAPTASGISDVGGAGGSGADSDEKGTESKQNITAASSTQPAFHRLRFPISQPLTFYTLWRGHTTLHSLTTTQSIYGLNTTPIDEPPFLTLLSEQLLAPFFLFQLLCVSLWCLDEYWYYALFTLFTLVLFECTVAYNRLKSVHRLRETLRNPYYLWVFRLGMWERIRSDALIVGDVVSLTSSNEDGLSGGGGGGGASWKGGGRGGRGHHHQERKHVPADLVLLPGGTAVVDEAMLTGESVPQAKEGVDCLEGGSGSGEVGSGEEERLDLEDVRHRKSILFGGTVLVNHGTVSSADGDDSSNTTETVSSEKGKKGADIPPPPDKGCKCLVLRTGFETQQGQLLRTMIHSAGGSNKADGVNTADTFLFILLLLLCAIGSAATVVLNGRDDPTRNQFKLMLHVIIIVTSVVPPELPMELSLAVTSSLSDLIKRCNVFCTEPFRIPLAGKVDVCCFDKTGTLTSDEMLLKGVRLAPSSSSSFGEEKMKDGKVGMAIPCKDGTNHGSNEDLILPRLYNAAEESAQDSSKDAAPSSDSSTAATLPKDVLRIMVGCQSLATTRSGSILNGPGEIIGDPLEKAVLDGVGWTLRSGSTVVPSLLPPSSSDHCAVESLKGVTIHHRFAFASKLKRMTTLVRDAGAGSTSSSRSSGSGDTLWALTKGAPETIRTLLDPQTIPSNYDEVYLKHMSLGQRVLALAHRKLGSNVEDVSQWKERGRDAVEKDLVFGGFMVLDCPLKSDSKRIVGELKESRLDAVMITGDAVLTAAEVARQVGIIEVGPEKTYELREVTHRLPTTSDAQEKEEIDVNVASSSSDGGTSFAFVPVGVTAASGDGGTTDIIALSGRNLKMVSGMVSKKEAAICVTGDVLTKVAIKAAARGNFLAKTTTPPEHRRRHDGGPVVDGKSAILNQDARDALEALVPCVAVFARHAPKQKEAVIAAFNRAGRHTLMCGDGTNDVGALKQAHVGVSIVSVPDLEAKQRSAEKAMASIRAEEKRERKARKKKQKLKDGTTSHAKKSKKASSSQSRMLRLEQSLQQLAEAEEELSYVALGDASVASPFTSRTMSIRCCKDILQQGRCTLVTMLQIYKILGVNCLVNALVLTKLHLHGVKQGDRQMTAVGFVVAGLFLFVTKGKPLSTLSPRRPPSSVLCGQALLSIALQFFVHFIAIMAVTHLSMAYVDPYDPSIIPDGPFNPNTLNTATFLMTVLATINTFVVNYRGHPFVEDLSENKLLLRSVQVCYGTLFASALEVFPPLNQLLQLAPLPTGGRPYFGMQGGNHALLGMVDSIGFQPSLCFLMVADALAAYGVEKAIVRYFEG